jgi:hypothetical protein
MREVWQGAAVRSLRDQHAALDFSTLPLCAACDGTARKAKD